MNRISCILSFFWKIKRLLLVLLFPLTVLLVISHNASGQQRPERPRPERPRPRVEPDWLDDLMFSVVYEPADKPSTDGQVAWMHVSGSGEFGPIGDEIQDLAIGPSGALWVATNSGLSRFANGKFRHFSRKNGMPHDQVLTLISTGRVVFAGTKEGLVWFDDLSPSDEIVPIPIKNVDGAVTSIFKRGNEFLFLIIPPDDHSKIGRLELHPNGLPEQDSLHIHRLETLVRRLLPGMGDVLLCQLQNGQWRQCRIPEDSENTSDTLLTLEEFSGSDPIDIESIGDAKLILTRNELLRQKNSNSAQSLADFDEKSNSDESFLSSNREGTKVWLGKKGNLWSINPENGKKLRHFQFPSGITPKAVAEEPNGRLWIGTENRGVFMSMSNTRSVWLVPFTGVIINFKIPELDL